MNDYSSLISSVVHLMSDKNPEVVQYATDAIIEMGRPAATKVCKSIITDINSYSSSVPTNRKVLINAIKEICKYSPESELIHAVCPTIINLVISLSPLDPEITSSCCEILSNFADRNSFAVLQEFREINVTFSLSEFLYQRACKEELTFFTSGNTVTSLFSQFCEKATKVTEEKTREVICNLLVQISDILSSTVSFKDGCCLSQSIGTLLEIFAVTWFKTSGQQIQKKILSCIGNAVSILGDAQLSVKAESFGKMYTDALLNKELKVFGARGAASFLMSVEKTSQPPKLQSQSLTKALVDFIVVEYPNMQMDGQIMKACNEAVGALSTLMILYPTAPLDMTIAKLPNTAALFILNYFCSSLAKTTHSTKLVDAISNIKFMQLKPEQKELYCTCYLTLIKKLTTKPPKMDDILKNLIWFIANDQLNARGTILSLIATMRQAEMSTYQFLYPKIFEYILDAHYFYAAPSLIEVASIMIFNYSEHDKDLEQIKIKSIQVVALLLSLVFTECLTSSTKSHIASVVGALTGIPTLPVNQIVPAILRKNEGNEYHLELLGQTQKLVDTYANCGGEKPIFPQNLRAQLRSGANIFMGHLMQSPFCQQRVDATTASIMQHFDRNDLYEIISIAKYIGFVARTLTDNAIKFVRTQADIIITNNDNKWKFWVKKDESGLPMAGVVIAASELMLNVPDSADLSQLFRLLDTNFLNDDGLIKYAKLRFYSAALVLASKKRLTIDNKKYGINVLSGLKAATDVLEAVAAIEGISAAFRIDLHMLGEPSDVITQIIGTIKPNWKNSDIVEVLFKAADIASSYASKMVPTQLSFITSFHEKLLSYIFGDLQRETLDAFSTFIDSIKSVDEDVTKLATFYSVVYLTTQNQKALAIVRKLTSLIGSYQEEITVQSIAEFLFNGNVQVAFEALISFSTCPYQYTQTAVDIMKAGSTTEVAMKDIPTFSLYFFRAYGAGMDVHECFDNFISKDSRVTIAAILAQPYTRRVSTLFASLMSRRELSRTVVSVLVDALESGEERGVTAFHVIADTSDSFRFETERERGIFFALCMQASIQEKDSESQDAIKRIVNTEITPKAYDPASVFASFLERSRTDRKKLLELSKRENQSLAFKIVACGCLSALLIYEDVATEAVSTLEKLSEDKEIQQNVLDALIPIAKAPFNVRAANSERAINISLRCNGDASQTILAISETMSETQMKNVGLDILKYVIKQLCASSGVPSVLKIIPAVCSSNSVMCEEESLKAIAAIYPLVLIHIFATDRDLAFRAAASIGRRLAYQDPKATAMSTYEFADSNSSILVSESKNPEAAGKALIQAAQSKDTKVRSIGLYMAAAAGADGIEEIVEEATQDESPEVRVAALKAIIAIESK